MSEIIGSYTKAIDELSSKIFIAGSIATLWVEAGPWLIEYFESNLVAVYILCVFVGFVGSSTLLVILGWIQSKTRGINVPPVVGVSLMPVGFAFIFPSHFGEVNRGSHQVAGVAILAWCFMLIKLEWSGSNA